MLNANNLPTDEDQNNAILASAYATLKFEAQAISAQAENLDRNFVAVVKYLIESQRMTFVAGIGKSGLVAQKIASKLACVGVKAIFLDPSDALHGELGLLNAHDLLIVLSKSGATGELVALSKAAKLRQAKVAAMVCRVPSLMSKLADWTIHVQIEREVTEIELPTTSAIAMVALGDAIVVAVANARGITAQDFARNHPAGNLGVLLGSQVDDVMLKVPQEVPVVTSEESLQKVIIDMTGQPVGAALVVDRENHLIGIVTDGDLRRSMKDNASQFMQLTVGSCMTKQPLSCLSGTSTLEALRFMENNPKKPVYVLPVVDKVNKVLGILRMHDLTSLQLREFHTQEKL